jgi:hypothetical protein
MKKVFLTAVAVLALGSFNFTEAKTTDVLIDNCGFDCIGIALNIDEEEDLTFEQFEAVINSCEALNVLVCNF